MLSITDLYTLMSIHRKHALIYVPFDFDVKSFCDNLAIFAPRTQQAESQWRALNFRKSLPVIYCTEHTPKAHLTSELRFDQFICPGACILANSGVLSIHNAQAFRHNAMLAQLICDGNETLSARYTFKTDAQVIATVPVGNNTHKRLVNHNLSQFGRNFFAYQFTLESSQLYIGDGDVDEIQEKVDGIRESLDPSNDLKTFIQALGHDICASESIISALTKGKILTLA